MRADRAHADVQLGRDLRVGVPPGDQGDQLPFPGAERFQCRGAARRAVACGPAAVSMRAYSAAVARLMAWPRSSAACVRAGPSARRASRRGSCRWSQPSGRSGCDGTENPSRPWSTTTAAHTVTASAQRPVKAHRYPQQSRSSSSRARAPVRRAVWSPSRRCAAASSKRPEPRSRTTIFSSRFPRLDRSPASRAPASPAAQIRSAAASSPTSISTVVRMWPHTRAIGPSPPAVICSACRASCTAPTRSPAAQATRPRTARASASATG